MHLFLTRLLAMNSIAFAQQTPAQMMAAVQRANDALFNSVLVRADLWRDFPAILSAGVGFDQYIGLPGALTKELVRSWGASWTDESQLQCHNTSETPPMGAYTSAVPNNAPFPIMGYDRSCRPESADGLPVCFSWPIIGRPAAEDFEFTLTDKEFNFKSKLVPKCASLVPNIELNERHCVVFFEQFAEKDSSYYPTKLRIVKNSGWYLVGPKGKHDPVGLELVTGTNAYQKCAGPRYVGAKLNKMSAFGEGAGSFGNMNPNGAAAAANSGVHLYGADAQYRIRMFYTGGMTPLGSGGMTPDGFERLWKLHVMDSGDNHTISKVGEALTTSKGQIAVIGLADLGTARETCAEYDDMCYAEDRDNYLDIVLKADNDEAPALVKSVEVASGLYNPGGPGMTPVSGTPFSVANSPQTIDVVNDLAGALQVTWCNDELKDNSDASASLCETAAGTAKGANSAATFPNPVMSCKPGADMDKVFASTSSRRSETCPMRTGVDGLVPTEQEQKQGGTTVMPTTSTPEATSAAEAAGGALHISRMAVAALLAPVVVWF